MHEPGTVLAFDFGLKRIGVAVGETAIGTTRPLTIIATEVNDARFAAIGALIREWQPVRLVVGLPRNDDGTEHELSTRCRRFANRLHSRFGLPVELTDERYSSLEAESELRREGRSWQARKALLDARAAEVILQTWFARHDRTA